MKKLILAALVLAAWSTVHAAASAPPNVVLIISDDHQILVSWPGRMKPQKSDRLALSLDIVPTVLAAAGLKPTAAMPGINLLDAKAVAGRNAIFGECFTHNSADLQRPAASLRWRWVIEGDWKLIVPAPQNEPAAPIELYHLAIDPDENKNLAGTEPERVKRLTTRLDAWWSGK